MNRCFLLLALFMVYCAGRECCYAQEMSVDTLISHHEEYWEKIQKIDLLYRIVGSELGNKDGKHSENSGISKNEVVYNFRWTKTNNCERYSRTLSEVDSSTIKNQGTPINAATGISYIRTGKKLLSAENSGIWDMKPKSFLESQEMGCSVIMDDMPNINFEYSMPFRQFLGRYYLSSSGSPAHLVTLRDLVKEWINIIPPVRSVDENGDVLWTLRLETPNWLPSLKGHNGKLEKNCSEFAKKFRAEFVFNESKHYCLQNYIKFTPVAVLGGAIAASDKNVKLEDMELVETTAVLEYQKTEDGCFFPKHIGKGFGGAGKYPEHYYIDRVLINDAVKTDACYIIPEYFKVYRTDLQRSAIDKDFAIHSIWGKNNEPLITFQTLAEYDKYMKEVAAYPLPVFGISKTRIALIVIGLIMVTTALIRLYFVREKK